MLSVKPPFTHGLIWIMISFASSLPICGYHSVQYVMFEFFIMGFDFNEHVTCKMTHFVTVQHIINISIPSVHIAQFYHYSEMLGSGTIM